MKTFFYYDLICFSPLRWNHPEQRVHQMAKRFSNHQRVFFIEPPVPTAGPSEIKIVQECTQLWVVSPRRNHALGKDESRLALSSLLKQLLVSFHIQYPVLWYSDVGAFEYSRDLKPQLAVYDVMRRPDHSEATVHRLELELIKYAKIVVNDGQKQSQHIQYPGGPVYAPGSMDLDHFWQSRQMDNDPSDQAKIPHPRVGFMGVINRTLDLKMLGELAEQRPDWHFVLIGPISIDTGPVLDRKNIHYLSSRAYRDLPGYLAGWDAAILPLMLDPHHHHYSALQMPQYLAAGLPVVSSPIPALARAYSNLTRLWFGSTVGQFEQGIEAALETGRASSKETESFNLSLIQAAWNHAWELARQTVEESLFTQVPAAESVPLRTQRAFDTV